MTDDDDPFGARDRTVIRPNPRSRRGPAQPAPPPQGGARPSATPVPPVSYPATGPNPPRTTGWPSQTPSRNPSAANPPSSRDPWTWTGGPAAPRGDIYSLGDAPPPMIPAPISPHIAVDLLSVATDPLMRSASSLLLMLGRLRVSLSQANAAELMDQVAQAIEVFEREAKDAKTPPEQIEAAKYALAATADDIVQNLPNLDPRYLQYSMLVRFFRDRTGGVRFYEELRKAKENPALNIGLLELMHACLSLGFEGKYRATGNFGELQAVRRDLYEAIRRNRPKTIEDLSPHWRGQPVAMAGSRFRVPVWAVTSTALALLLVVYVVLRWWLANDFDALLNRVALPHDLVAIAREAPVKKVAQPPAPKTTQYQRITSALEQEINDKLLSLPEQTATRIIIRVGSVTRFAKAEAKVDDSFLPTAEKIAAALDKEPGKIFVDGYTDNDPIRTIQYPSNYELSQARAAAVAKILERGLSKPDRVVVSGKADTNPVAPNDNDKDKEQNRRVEISIQRAD